MTYTINGIGTHQYGKDRRISRHDECDQCGRVTVLQSYDTTKYIVVLFVPVIPLGKLRILDHCSDCNRWKQIKLQDWNAQKDVALRESLARLKQDHRDPDAVKQAIATATQFQDESILLKFSDLAAGMTNDEEVQILYSAALSYFGNHSDSVPPLKHALAVNDCRETREQLAYELLQSGKPDEAEKYVDYIWAESDPALLPLRQAITHCYHETGNQDAAISRVDRIATLHPDLAKNKEFIAFRKQTEKRQVKVARQFDRKPSPPEKKFNFSAIVAPVIVALLLLGYVGSAVVKANARKVHIVNGLPVSYVAIVEGQEVPLSPGDRREITIQEGPISISGNGNDFEIPEKVIDISTPFFSRPFRNPTIVINPDQNAIFERSEIIYTDRPGGDADIVPVYSTGELLLTLTDVDYPFRRPPDEIEVSDTSREYRRSILSIIPSDHAIYYLDAERMTTFCKRQFNYGLESHSLVHQFAAITTADDFIEFSRPFLDRRPISIEWHRAYQELIEKSKPDYDLAAEYQAMCAADPDNSGLLYLQARITPDHEQKSRLLDRAVNTTSEVSPYAFYGKGYDFMSKGEFREGLPLVEQAVNREPNNTGFTNALAICLEAVGRWGEAAEKLGASVDHSSPFTAIQELPKLIPLLVSAGLDEEAENRIRSTLRSLDLPSEAKAQIRNSLEQTLRYASGDFKLMRERFAEEEDLPFWLLVSDKNFMRAAERLQTETTEGDPSAYIYHLLLYVGFADTGEPELAERHLGLAVEQLQAGGRDDRRLAELLKAPKSAADSIFYPTAWPEQSRSIALAMSRRFPGQKMKYVELAKRLNVARTFPYWFIVESTR